MLGNGKERPALANALTICRIVLSLVLLAPPALSPTFFVLYAAAGATDMADGFIARKTGATSELGARLDSIADIVLAVVCLVRVLPAITVPVWLWGWIALIVIVKVSNVVSGLVTEKRLVLPHTVANKVAGMAAFLLPFALPFVDIAVPAIPVCAIATFAAVQEGHLMVCHG